MADRDATVIYNEDKPSARTAAGSSKSSRREGEEEDDAVASWEESSDEASKPTSTAQAGAKNAAQKKKGSLKQKLAEKEADRKRRLEKGEHEPEYMDMREKFMDEKEMRRVMREKELEADMSNASDLFGAASINPTPPSKAEDSPTPSSKAASNTTVTSAKIPPHLAPFLNLPSKLTTKADFDALSRLIYNNLVKPHATSTHYASFVEGHSRTLCSTLNDTQVKKVATGLTGLASEKASASRASARKKPGQGGGLSGKGALAGGGSGKGKHDLTAYDDDLDDFGDDPDDFM